MEDAVVVTNAAVVVTDVAVDLSNITDDSPLPLILIRERLQH